MLNTNPRATRAPYPAEHKAILSIEKANESREWLSYWDKIAPEGTPLRELPGLAAKLGVGSVSVKDESERSVLGSFSVIPIEAMASVQYMASWPYPWAHALMAGDDLTTHGLFASAFLVIVYLVLNYWGVKLFIKTNTAITISGHRSG